MMWRLWGMVGAAALLAAAVCLDASGARADKVGVAAAVNPDAFSSLAGSPQTQLNIGKSIFFNERINTTTSGLVQVLLVDGSTFTVGPGSDLVINKFVYDPKKGTGQITASFSKGVMRFVGGKISKSDNAVSINTPAGALAVRGCIILGNIIDRSNYQFIMPYGVYMQLNNDKVWEGGYGIFRLNGRSEIRPATATDLKVILSGLNNGNNSGGGETQSNSGGAKPGTAFLLAETANEIVSEATATEIQNTIATPQDTACTGAACNPQPETPEAHDMHVLSSPGVYTAFPGSPNTYTTGDGASQGILGGGTYPPPQSLPGGPFADDFTSTFTVEGNRLVGTVTGLIDAHCAGENCAAPQQPPSSLTPKSTSRGSNRTKQMALAVPA